ncbi:hypothetical protein [Saccharopolyspora phatthalungensis]|uniref:Uncharacterized protein n=1 Tax=Saccharopolyspora phatthalungensis TaxID=664693 RepID=A0A840PZP2_9PSEU|nr:hypothetical protein [Saccharopolyspora phatthalungensis]MBB5153494.1 hypothetical protein [Saccharopolyspora phatthalungensis]
MSSPQPPDGGQQGSDPISNRMDPQDPNQAGSDATQVVRPVQSQGQQPPSDSTQVVPPSMQPPQPMYQQPGLADQGSGAEATAMVPPSMQPPQPMYQQPGTQSQPGGFPAQPQQSGTPSGGFPAPQAQGGFGAQPPQAAYGQPAQQGQGNAPLAKTTAIVAIVLGGLNVIFGILGIVGLAVASSKAAQYGVHLKVSMGLLYTLVIVGFLCAIAWIVGGILLLKRKPIGPLLVGGAAAVSTLSGIISVIMYPNASAIVGLVFGIALAVLAFLPGTRQWAAGSGTPAPAAAGSYGQPQQFGQPGQPQQFGQPGQQQFGQPGQPQFGQPGQPQQFGQPGQQQFGQPGQPQQFGQPQQYGQPGQQPGGFPPPSGQQPPQW